MHANKPISADDLFTGMFETDSDKQAMREYLHARRLVSKLSAMRAAKGLTQTDVANSMGCKQSKISKLESGVDADVLMADVLGYAKAIDCDATVLISDRGKSLAEQIKFHAFSIRNAFMKLVELAHKDDLIAQGVAKLHIDAFHNINRMLAETADQLPVNAESGERYLHIAAEDDCGPSEERPVIKISRDKQSRRVPAHG